MSTFVTELIINLHINKEDRIPKFTKIIPLYLSYIERLNHMYYITSIKNKENHYKII